MFVRPISEMDYIVTDRDLLIFAHVSVNMAEGVKIHCMVS